MSNSRKGKEELEKTTDSDVRNWIDKFKKNNNIT